MTKYIISFTIVTLLIIGALLASFWLLKLSIAINFSVFAIMIYLFFIFAISHYSYHLRQKELKSIIIKEIDKIQKQLSGYIK